jgi:uncharacterized membrane protein YoaK (UPF0700 family)
MLIREGAARDTTADRRLASSLAFIAGALNTSGFYAIGLYSSNMTGNVSAIADHLAVRDFALAAMYLALVAIFILGAAISTLLINAGRTRRLTGIYALSIFAESVLLAALGGVDLFVADARRGVLMVFGLSFLMGLQNALVTRISNARVRTTHVTGMVTDIGIELANLLSHRRGAQDGAGFDREKLRLHAQTVAAFLLGGAIGVIAYRRIGPALLFAGAAWLLVLAVPGLLAWRAAGAGARAPLGE